MIPEGSHGRKPKNPAGPTWRGRLALPLEARDALRRLLDRGLGFDLLWSALFVVYATLVLGTGRCAPAASTGAYRVGEHARHDIVSPVDFVERDEKATERRRAEARRATPEVYVHDGERGRRVVQELEALLRREGGGGTQEKRPGAVGVLPERVRDPEVRRALVAALERAMQGLVVANRALLERQPEIVLLHLPERIEERVARYDGIVDLDEARGRVRNGVSAVPGLAPDETAAFAGIALRFVDVNVTYDPQETARRRESAAAAVPPVLVHRQAGSVLVRSGERVSAEALYRLEDLGREREATGGFPRLAGLVVVIAMLAFFLHRYTRYHQRNFRKVRHLHALLTLVLLLTLFVAQGVLWVAKEATDNLSPPYDRLDLYAYLVPLGGGAILVALLANGRISMIYSTFAAVLFGGLTGWNVWRMLWALLVQWAGVYAITTYRDRAALLRAGLVVGGAGAVATLAVQSLGARGEPLGESLLGAGLAFAGGALGVGLLVSFTLPLFEGLFNVLTDIRLLELSNADHPLLSELAIKAPGSYNHSLVVGTLAEEAAKAIGANALFCRVAAFYHDIGKLRKPEYYVENQRDTNPHDRLAPSMSALVISAHVKDGVRMAREAGLPEQIVEIIPQHHGTRLMAYFFEKARKRTDRDHQEVREDDFRYPGPKPQTREAAIFMLADGVEAAARTLQDPTPSRLREVIHRLTSSVVLDGQLDECDLTFADLEKIEQAFSRSLVSMHHHRVDYPGFDFDRSPAESRDASSPRAARGSS